MIGSFSANPLITLQKAWVSGRLQLRLAALAALLLGTTGLSISYLGFSYLLERIGNILTGVAILILFLLETVLRADVQNELAARIERAEQAVERNPESARPLWDLARSRLELYFERNLSQIRSIFWITLAVMASGFGTISYGILRAFDGGNLQASLLAAVSGVVTQFIGATFLIIYRSTMSQAGEYVRTLERINAVGMAIQISDSIPEESTGLRSRTRAELGLRIMDTFGNAWDVQQQESSRRQKVVRPRSPTN